MNEALLGSRLAIIAGKGGVGRTTVATALALVAARQGKRVLLCEIHGRDRATRLLGHPPIGSTRRRMRGDLWVANVTGGAALEEYVLSVVRSRRIYRRLFGPAAVAAFVRGVPGLDDLMMMGKIRFHVDEMRAGRPRWDLVVVDAPATGSGLFFLELPEALLRVVQSGPLGHYARKMRALLQDRARTSVHVVTLAEEMPVVESCELVEALRERLRLPLGMLIVNRVRPAPLDARSIELLARLGDAADDSEIERLAAAGRWTLGRWRLQQASIDELRRKLGLPLVTLPELEAASLGPDELERIADALAASH